MKIRLVLVVIVALAGCGPASGAASPSPSALPASPADLTPYFGSYAMPDGDTVVIARLGWYFDMRTADYRTIYKTASAGRFTIGTTFGHATPTAANLDFNSGMLTVTTRSGRRAGTHVANVQADFAIPSGDAQLAATVTTPPGTGPHPAIVIVHGSEPGERYFYDIWVGLYTSLGLAVLTYDKRGIGASTGSYPGDSASQSALTTYADDAEAVRAFLARRPGIDPKRVGFHGGSQGGWTVPLAMLRHPGAAFAVLASAPATTVDQTNLWKDFSDGGASVPAETTTQMLAAVRATHSGYDPLAALKALDVPALWLLGVNDRTVPTAVCVEILDSLHKPNFTLQLLPTGHGLQVNPTGMLAGDANSPGLAPQLVPAIKAWLAQVT